MCASVIDPGSEIQTLNVLILTGVDLGKLD